MATTDVHRTVDDAPFGGGGWVVPGVARSGDHGRVAAWRRAAALAPTAERRPDLIAARGGLSAAGVQLLRQHGYPDGSPPGTNPPPERPAASDTRSASP